MHGQQDIFIDREEKRYGTFKWNKPKMTLFIILLLAIFLRLYQLGNNSLWFGEVISLYWSDFLTPQRLLRLIMQNQNPYPFPHYPLPHLLYPIFIRYWELIGTTETILRLSSVIFGMASIIGIYYLGNLFFGKRTGIISAFLLTISPFHIYYSQELKMYSLISFLSIMCIYFLSRALKEKKNTFWIGYIIFNVINIYMHHMTSLFLFAQVIFFLIYIRRYRPLFKKWLISHLAILLLLIPWIRVAVPFIIFAIATDEAYLWSYPPLIPVPLKIFFTFQNFCIGYNATRLIYLPASVLYLFLFIRGSVKTKEREKLVLSLCCLIIPGFIMVLISKHKGLYGDRYIIPSSIFLYLMVANGLSLFKRRYSALFLTFIIILSALALRNYYNNCLFYISTEGKGMLTQAVMPRKEHKEAANYIAENFRNGDAIFHTCINTTFPFRWYFALKRPEMNRKYEDEIVLQLERISDKPMPYIYKEANGTFRDYSKRISMEGFNRVWLIFSHWEFERALQPNSLEARIKKWMDSHYIQKEFKKFKGIVVYLYIRPQE